MLKPQCLNVTVEEGGVEFRWDYQSRGHRWVQWPYKQQHQLRSLLLPCENRKKARWEVSSPQHQAIYFSKVTMEKQTFIDSFGLCYFIALAWDDKDKCLRQESSITQKYLSEKGKHGWTYGRFFHFRSAVGGWGWLASGNIIQIFSGCVIEDHIVTGTKRPVPFCSQGSIRALRGKVREYSASMDQHHGISTIVYWPKSHRAGQYSMGKLYLLITGDTDGRKTGQLETLQSTSHTLTFNPMILWSNASFIPCSVRRFGGFK